MIRIEWLRPHSSEVSECFMSKSSEDILRLFKSGIPLPISSYYRGFWIHSTLVLFCLS